MRRRAAPLGALASTLLASIVGAAQPVQDLPHPPGSPAKPGSAPMPPAPSPAPAPAVPPGLIPVFPPGASAAGVSATALPPPSRAAGLPFGLPRSYAPQPLYPYPAAPIMGPPLQIPYEEGQTIPFGYDLKTRRVRSLILAGSLTFSGAYVASAILAGVEAPVRPLFAPVVGPFVTIGTAHADAMGTLWLALDGMAQTAGAVLFVQGMVTREKYLQREVTSALDVLAHPQIVVGPRAAGARWAF